MTISTTPVPPPPLVRSRADGARRWFAGGGVHTWLATEQDTGGAFLLWEDEMVQGKCSPLHSHAQADETSYVLEGEILFHLDGAEHRMAAGAVALAPRGVPHAFLVLSATARLLFLHTPGCCQDFYWEASTSLPPGESGGEVDFDVVMAAARRTGGMTMLGPPPFTR